MNLKQIRKTAEYAQMAVRITGLAALTYVVSKELKGAK